jgi:hypothetical protein
MTPKEVIEKAYGNVPKDVGVHPILDFTFNFKFLKFLVRIKRLFTRK